MSAAEVEAIAALRDVVRIAKAASIGVTRNTEERIPRAERAIAAMVALIAADHEYDAARRDWDNATLGDPTALSDAAWKRIATRFEEATMHRIACLDGMRDITTPAAATAAPSTP